eukprot:TRINITY_DN75066_c0_g1_i1.p1 TRINITY_DN75066_c0_g1~~TRINITY_DN75066_c0_g1_i1.p1  ORF type:complete len:370 (-),score=74.81 TRINITY_DN75066_c0_g1_i1:264-1373(-)
MAFVRRESAFRNWLGGQDFPYENGRYVLYVARACGWANRASVTYNLKGLTTKHMEVSIVHPTWQRTRPDGYVSPFKDLKLSKNDASEVGSQLNSSLLANGGDKKEDLHCGWKFAKPGEGVVPVCGVGSIVTDDVIEDKFSGYNAQYVRDLYEISETKLNLDHSTGPFTVPLIWDKSAGRIVNNESSEIIQMLDAWPVDDQVKPAFLNPENLREEMKPLNDRIYSEICNGVYRCGFCQTQEAYDEAAASIAKAMNWLEEHLKGKTFLVGETLTLADVRAFPQLMRMEDVYVVYFKCNHVRIDKFPNIKRYLARLYAIRAFRDSINMDDIRKHYFTSHAKFGPFAIVPAQTSFLSELEEIAKAEGFKDEYA